ncbi:DNA binding protein [Cellulophaga phage phi19:2]|uniref:DNA binding protein n=3 Tax=Cellulophaga phage phiST TaxID=756282 RepID=M4SN91_9CAUD|nr:hypothetical protein CGPG_00041 [Cellulophaga phage phiST]AGH56740.1 hypothetical protein CGPG_00041 [Cellulophaga phage phiST]AGO47207.1 DNA binding protein [Cellulophaga phage phiST]AGO48703.1 DNA binding protein [Cellulophaga phage phi19:2]AGO49073.1 DNA binding protein [Cellulophaga phage phi13:1]
MEKRKLKPARKRKDYERMNFTSLCQQIEVKTGFREDDIKKVWRAGIDIIIESIMQKKSVALPILGMFYPMIRPSRSGVALHGGQKAPEKIIVPALFQLKFRVGKEASSRLASVEPTKEEIDYLYED